MDKITSHQINRTLHQTVMPERVLLLCDGLLQINADFLATHLDSLLNEFESILFKEAENSKGDLLEGGQFSRLRNLKRTRYDFIPQFLKAVEHFIASIRPQIVNQTPYALENNNAQITELHLLDENMTDEQLIQFEISSRCESQNSFEIFLLGQRFGVLAAQPAFEADKLPISPKIFGQCLIESIQSLDLETLDKKTLYFLFERHVFSNFSILLELCNKYLIENSVLPNLSYIPFRNPELRNKKSPIALNGSSDFSVKNSSAESKANPIQSGFELLAKSISEKSWEAKNIDSSNIEEGFSSLRKLLSKRKQLLNKLGSFSNYYQNENVIGNSNIAEIPPEVLGSILSEFQINAANNPNTRVSIQHLKHDLLIHLRNQSTESVEMKLTEEDSDAIDLVGLLMDEALKDVNPNSSVSQLLSLMQTPLIRVVMQDKSFFSNHIHPARQMLNIIAETGFNWLDEHSQDDALHGKISTIVNKTVREFNGDNQELVDAYEQTNRILQVMMKNADAAERRQVNAISGKERLIAARLRAEKTMFELVETKDIPISTLNLLNNAWADVMALTELRQGSNSTDWLDQKNIAESIIAANLPKSKKPDAQKVDRLKNKIQKSLALIGYDQNEALSIAEILLDQRSEDSPTPSLLMVERIRFGGDTISANQNAYQLNAQQLEFMKQIKQIPIGTWFEFKIKENSTPLRRKLAWKSELTNNILFVNQRGQKTSEMMIEELAIELTDGTAKIQFENKRSIFIMAFQNLFNSLKELMPNSKDAKNV